VARPALEEGKVKVGLSHAGLGRSGKRPGKGKWPWAGFRVLKSFSIYKLFGVQARFKFHMISNHKIKSNSTQQYKRKLYNNINATNNYIEV
jgi:hypothetical protein